MPNHSETAIPSAPRSSGSRNRLRQPHPIPRRDDLQELVQSLGENLVEREVPLRLTVLAALAGEHILLIGPPGTAKSELARRLRMAFDEGTYFERLLTRFSVPEELFGPLSIKGLEADRYERLTEGYLPTATVAFLDEIFKANSAILNSLLTVLNERKFDNGQHRVDVPLACVIGASNELPEGPELAALYDRFLLRYAVTPVSDRGFERLVALTGNEFPTVEEGLRLSREDLERARTAAEQVELPNHIINVLCSLRKRLDESRTPVSDRRWRKIVKLLKTSAFTCGRQKVNIWDCWLLQHCAWQKPDGRELIAKWYSDQLGRYNGHDPAWQAREIEAWERRLEDDQATGPQATDSNDRLLYRAEDGSESASDGASYRNDPRRPPIIQTMSVPNAYVDDQLRQVNDLRGKLTSQRDRIDEWRNTAERAIRNHLWIEIAFLTTALDCLQSRFDQTQQMVARVERVLTGYQQLPRVEEDQLGSFRQLPLPIQEACRVVARHAIERQRRERKDGTTPQSVVQFSTNYYEPCYTCTVKQDSPAAVLKAVQAINEHNQKHRSEKTRQISNEFFRWLRYGAFASHV